MPTPPIQAIIAKVLTDALTPDESTGEEDETANWSVFSPPASTAIVQVKHRLRDGMMTVRFTGGPVDYLFINVPRELFRQWKRVVSAGKFYHRRIKGQWFNVS